MIDISREQLISLAQAAKLRPCGRRGRPLHPATMYRWISRGIRGVRLEFIRLGGTLYTSREAMQRFADRLTAGSLATTPPTEATQGSKEIERIERELDAAGI